MNELYEGKFKFKSGFEIKIILKMKFAFIFKKLDICFDLMVVTYNIC